MFIILFIVSSCKSTAFLVNELNKFVEVDKYTSKFSFVVKILLN